MQKACREPCRASPTPRTAKVIAMHQRRCSEASLMLLAWQSQVRLLLLFGHGRTLSIHRCVCAAVGLIHTQFPTWPCFLNCGFDGQVLHWSTQSILFPKQGPNSNPWPSKPHPIPSKLLPQNSNLVVKADAQLAKVGGGWEQMARDAKWTLWPCLPCLDCRGIRTFRRRCWQPIARVMKQCYDSAKN